jgi:phenylpyruvate tautomerase PptA (4-oxalocrotonate tautomerase family)
VRGQGPTRVKDPSPALASLGHPLPQGERGRKRALAKGLTNVVAEVGKVPVKSIHVVIREGRGLHYMFGGEHVPEFKPAGGG